jgi:NTP pyrophosphatase (non-canonical NTP hydrolase)
MLDLTEVQERTWANKVRKGFNTTDVNKEIIMMLIEIGEATEAWARGHRPDLADELADTVIFAVCVARMAQVELPDVLLVTDQVPELLPPSKKDVQRVLLLLFREGVKVGDAWRFQDLDALAKRIDGVITAACRLARMHAIDLADAIVRKMAVNDSREYVRDDRSGQMVKV